MFLIEIGHPADTLTPEDRDILAGRLVELLLVVEGAPEATMRRARTMTHIAFRELHGWRTGDGPLTSDTAPPLIVTITLPEEWREETSSHVISGLRAVVHRLDTARGWSRLGGDLWINVLGVPNGSIGLNGKASTADDVLAYMTEGFRAELAEGTGDPIPDGTLLDPICGMLVSPGEGSILLDHGGDTIGFCSLGCRDAYAREHDLSVA